MNNIFKLIGLIIGCSICISGILLAGAETSNVNSSGILHVTGGFLLFAIGGIVWFLFGSITEKSKAEWTISRGCGVLNDKYKQEK